MTVSTDLIYDVLRSHEPDHILLQATRADAATGLLTSSGLGDMLARVKGISCTSRLTRFRRWRLPVMLEIGRERVAGEAMKCCLKQPTILSGKQCNEDCGVGKWGGL